MQIIKKLYALTSQREHYKNRLKLRKGNNLYFLFSKLIDKKDSAKLTVVDFDCWVGGFVSGHSCTNQKMQASDYDVIIKHLVLSPQAKRCGVTGTEKEIMSFYELK